jgi:hypothetical protein
MNTTTASGALTARAMYAFSPRQGGGTVARYHAVLDQPVEAERFRRKAGDPLCKPREKFWGLAVGNRAAKITCPDCAALMARHGITVENR